MEGYKHLSNKPCGKDLFESKAHTKIAKKLAEKIREEKIKLFGLEGGLGTGKSNVALLAEKKLEETHHFFIFDAWGHQEDLQRRALLEELTTNLCKNRILDNNEEWEEKLENLLARKTVETKKTFPKISDGIVMVFVIFFLNSFFNDISNEAIKSILPMRLIKWGQGLRVFTKELVLLTMKNWLVVIVALGWTTWKVLKRRKEAELEFLSLKTMKCIWVDFKEVFFIFKEKEIDKTVATVTSTKEPSVREFNNWMNDLGESLADKKVVIVFDNMDRISKEKVRALWSSIHTFFSEETYPNISVVIPFDREQLNKFFITGSEEFQEEDVIERVKEGDLFISKTFSKIYRVPSLVLSDWESFFDSKLEEAIDHIPKEESIIIKNLYDLKTKYIRPREIINFINDLISLKEVWGEEIQLKYMAVFILNKERILSHPLNEIINKSYLEGINHFFEGDEEVDDNIAALVYGVSPEIASQVVLEREVLKSLNSGKKDRIQELSKHSQFFNVLNRIAVKITNLQECVETLENIEVPEKDKEFNKMIWDTFSNKFLSHKQKNFTFQKYHELLIERLYSKRSKIIDHLVNDFEDFSKVLGATYAHGIIEIDNFLKEKDFSKLNEILKEKKMSPANYIDYLKVVQSEYKKYKVTVEGNIEEYLEKHYDALLEENLKMDFIQYLVKECHTENFEGKIKNDANNSRIPLENIFKVYKAYFSLGKKPLENYLDGNTATNHLWDLLQLDNIIKDEFYILISIFMKEYESLSKTSQFINSNRELADLPEEIDNEVIKGVSKYIEYFMNYGDVLLKSISGEVPLIRKIARYLTLNEVGVSRANITELLKNYKGIKKALNIDCVKTIENLDKWSQVAKKKINTENIKEVLVDTDFIKDSIEMDLELTKHIREIYIAKIGALSKEDFLEELRSGEYYYLEVIKLLVEARKVIDIPYKIVSAFKEALKNIADEEIELTTKNEEVLEFLYGVIDEEKLKSTLKDIRDNYLNNRDIKPKLFLFFGEKLCKFAQLEEKTEEVTRKIINKVFHSKECRDFILREKEIFLNIIKKSKEAIHDFEDKIREAFEKDKNEDLIKFAKDLDIILVDKKENSEEE